MQDYTNFIDGARLAPTTGQYLETENPYTTKTWARIARSGPEDVDRAVAAAKAAFTTGAWSRLTAPQRGALLRRFAELIVENAEELARIEVTDNGKPLSEMLPQVKKIADWLIYYAGLADKIAGATLATDKPGFMAHTLKEPLGIIAMITPWNSPLMLLTWKLAPALAAGNVAVVKPSEYTSVSALRYAELASEAGFPPGVINVVTGLGQEVGTALTAHPDVAKVAFTGGGAGGRAVYRAASDRLVPVTLELGGKSPNIVFEDADIDMAIKGIVSGIFASGGQSCVAGSRALIQRPLLDKMLPRMAQLAGKIRLGDPMSPETDIGPVATRPQFERIQQCIAWAKEDGATLLCGGAPVPDPAGGPALFVAPTIFTDVRSNMRIAQEEVFGPVLSVIPFDTEEEALEIANDTPFGLGAGIWTRDLRRAMVLSRGIKAGTVWVNAYKGVSQTAPFGGFKESGIGREGGAAMIDAYLQTKTVWLNLTDSVPYAFPQ
ncbi:aldehyde dehydrogenase [Alloyangia pacifica]|uniref:Aldehyde dehydrogenase (NAD+) n=1 Tax=Alloyangia pacifica TaxID=311180 RepID=A0A1I6VHV5_9RHOB|nr:aldehyde dehydrogenase [Alloyangia pacifica]SDH98588.1 aldehyde dehydrogenase (NAD+) [Alloyangia pacifica]SFT13211.1 aldehyde dehydrogenase (NAD+) [Alloyangia pacifica]